MRTRLLLICLLGSAALAAGCGSGEDGSSASKPAKQQAALSVSWAADPGAGPGPLGVVLFAPNDAVPAKGRVEDPSRPATLFDYRAPSLRGYQLEVRGGRRCGERRCDVYDPNGTLCIARIHVRAGESLPVSIRLGPRGRCELEKSG